MLKTFLKPGWVLLLLFVVAFSYLAFTVLAPWQLGKDDDIVERNELITHAYEADPQPVEDLVDGNGAIKDDEWSRATLHGHYLPQDEVLLRLRPVDSGPSYQSLVPFRTDSGLTILVNRGWVKAGEANAVPDIPAAPSGETTLTGMIRADEAQHQSAPIKQEGYQQVYSIHTEQIASLIDAPLAHDYIQLSADQPGVLNPMPIPQLDRGNHLSYGYQWIAFGIMAPLGLGYFVWSEIRERRRAREEEAALASAAVKRLEGELGLRLLTRTTRAVTPTSAGLGFHAQVADILSRLDAAFEAFNDTKQQREDVVKNVNDECGIDLSQK